MSRDVSRRAFLSTTGLTVTGIMMGARRLGAADISPRTTPAALMHEPLTPTFLESLATAAVDAAKRAGASYADVRVAESQSFWVGKAPGGPLAFGIGGDIKSSFGVRAMVDGVWGFVHGDVPTIDAIAGAAQGAVAQARTASKTNVARGAEFVSAPVVNGMWRTPMEIDPFTVPLHEQMALLRSWMDTSEGLWRVGGISEFQWNRETRTFASTEGSLVTQRFHRVSPYFTMYGDRGLGGRPVVLSPPFITSAGGYETVADVKIHDQIRATGEQIQRYMALPAGNLDVGRYPVAMDGLSFGTVFYHTVGVALEMDRVLGDEADASGTSYLSPADQILGAPIFPSLLNVTADRALPSVSSVQWDDEGVVPMSGPVITSGAVVDYQTSRATAGSLRTWYRQHHRPVASRGYAVATETQYPVQVRAGHLTVAPGASMATMDDLIRDMAHGVVVIGATWVASDQQLTSANLSLNGNLLIEVERGRMVRRLKDVALEWNTLPFFKKLSAVGDATTMYDSTGATDKGIPWHTYRYHVSAPAALFKEVNVIDTGREL